jgi:hypothetical protein
MKSAPNWISYLHANSWIFIPHLAILFNFLKSKTYHDFPNFNSISIREARMVKIVHLFKTCCPICLYEFLEHWKVVFGVNQLELEFYFIFN